MKVYLLVGAGKPIQYSFSKPELEALAKELTRIYGHGIVFHVRELNSFEDIDAEGLKFYKS